MTSSSEIQFLKKLYAASVGKWNTKKPQSEKSELATAKKKIRFEPPFKYCNIVTVVNLTTLFALMHCRVGRWGGEGGGCCCWEGEEGRVGYRLTLCQTEVTHQICLVDLSAVFYFMWHFLHVLRWFKTNFKQVDFSTMAFAPKNKRPIYRRLFA